MGEQQMVLRRPPFGSKVKSAHDMGRENKVLSALSKSYSKAPKPLIYTEDESIIGAPFYIMERVNGVILRNNRGFDNCTDCVDVLDKWSNNTLYKKVESKKIDKTNIKLIPYYAWSNRGKSDMSVWLPVNWN